MKDNSPKEKTTGIRLSKVLAAAGVASRRKCEEIIFDGRVTVNGKKVTVPQTLVNAQKDSIAIDGQKIKTAEQKVYYIFNKPRGFECTNALHKKKRVLSFFEDQGLRLFTIGRLDRDTSGLLLVTNDGHFANQVIHPSSDIEKEYLVKVDREVEHAHLVKISKGMMIEHTFVKPKKVLKVRKSTIKIIVTEGKKRQVRQLVEQADLNVHSLCRIRIGGLRLGTLKEGDFRPLTKREKELIFE
jgi:23S rRNA pseudouridine2605 synthase